MWQPRATRALPRGGTTGPSTKPTPRQGFSHGWRKRRSVRDGSVLPSRGAGPSTGTRRCADPRSRDRRTRDRPRSRSTRDHARRRVPAPLPMPRGDAVAVAVRRVFRSEARPCVLSRGVPYGRVRAQVPALVVERPLRSRDLMEQDVAPRRAPAIRMAPLRGVSANSRGRLDRGAP
jgi:hypothetical protein